MQTSAHSTHVKPLRNSSHIFDRNVTCGGEGECVLGQAESQKGKKIFSIFSELMMKELKVLGHPRRRGVPAKPLPPSPFQTPPPPSPPF